MNKIYTKVTDKTDFYNGNDPILLTERFGTPLYVYSEKILREKCRDLKNMVTYPKFVVDYSAKANSNIAFLQIVKSECLEADAMSPGEIAAELLAGFSPKEIFYICNNVSEEEMRFAIEKGVLTSVDSVSQLEQYGRLNPGGDVAIRFNSGIGAGHCDKVVTGGKKTKFAVDPVFIPVVKEILKKYNLNLVGINQHIGSLFMDADSFISSISSLLDIASNFDTLKFIDMGGGFGIPYKKEFDEKPLDIEDLGKKIDEALFAYAKKCGKQLTFRIEPGRYISAESSVLLGRVNTVKTSFGKKYIGTDIGFNVLARPIMYDSYHGIEIYRKSDVPSLKTEEVTVVGNICESGDKLTEERELPEIFEGDIIGVLDAGAYGHVMSSNYNNRLRPAEVLIRENGEAVLIRKRDTLDDLFKNQLPLKEV